MCDCINKTNELLERGGHNTVIDFPIIGPRRTFVRTLVKTPKRGAKPVSVFATYCPFCGEPYPEPVAPTTQAEG